MTDQVDSVRKRGWSASPQDVHTLISATCKHYLYGKGDSSDVIKDLETGRLFWIISGGGASVIIMVFLRRSEGRRKRRRSYGDRDWRDPLWWWRKRPQAKKYKLPLETKEGRKQMHPSALPEGIGPADTLTWLSEIDFGLLMSGTSETFELKKCLCCLKLAVLC